MVVDEIVVVVFEAPSVEGIAGLVSKLSAETLRRNLERKRRREMILQYINMFTWLM